MKVIFDLEGTLINGPSRSVFTGVIELLQEFENRGIPLYLWTGAHSSVKPLLKELELTSYFKDFCFCNIDYPKPDPRGITAVIGGNDGDLFVIGDTRYDLKGAKSLGAKFIAACWADEKVETELIDLGAEMFAMQPKDVLKYIIG